MAFRDYNLIDITFELAGKNPLRKRKILDDLPRTVEQELERVFPETVADIKPGVLGNKLLSYGYLIRYEADEDL